MPGCGVVNKVGALRVQCMLPVLRAVKMVVHPCTTREGLISHTFPKRLFLFCC